MNQSSLSIACLVLVTLPAHAMRTRIFKPFIRLAPQLARTLMRTRSVKAQAFTGAALGVATVATIQKTNADVPWVQAFADGDFQIFHEAITEINVNSACNENGDTPLMLAASLPFNVKNYEVKQKLICSLLTLGADPLLKNKDKKTALDIASELGDIDNTEIINRSLNKDVFPQDAWPRPNPPTPRHYQQ